ncbi:peptidylprolyl isomerase [Candidatus Clostridium stratigraminis]|uniref:Peptidylprolyl isomerase n=1 Tax=Candidatus Clostridium stratigraminis TaxID=3381661 RepID=A0ABW8TAM5_9CLOT
MEQKIIAVVNGKEITENDLNNAILRFPKDKQGYLSTEEGKKQLLDQLISFELIYSYALDNEIQKNEDYLINLEAAKKELLTQTAIRHILKDVNVTDEEVKNYYEANKNYFMNEETVSARHILVDSFELANEIKNKIDNGLNFEMAAMQYSSCPSKEQGGNLGQFTRGRMVPEFENAAFELAVGQTSDPVKTQFGYHIIKVDEKVSGIAKPLEEVFDIIKNEILSERESFKYMQFTEGLKNVYGIELK